MKRTGNKGFTTIVLLLVIAGLGYYTYLSNHANSSRDIPKDTEVEQLLTYDFENDYPKTVRETVKLHCRYLKCAYNAGFTEDELSTANRQIRKLFDQELLEFNSEEAQLQDMKEDIKLYDEKKQKFTSYSLGEASQVVYNTENGKDYAKIKATIVLRVDAVNMSVDREYILRKDEDGRWKILGWESVTNKAAENEGDAE
ncbi:MAG: hypothetical protein IJ801_03980 [Lachnospiraceae bacterium]|nr:hypothetical protein [Lachnospiraceae bacterium]